VQVGSTAHPIVIEYDATGSAGWTALTEWSAGVGAGTYYRIDYNLAELWLVNASNVIQVPVAAAKIRYTLDYSTNAVTFDTKVASGYLTKDWWDLGLRVIGRRKATLRESRYYNPNTCVLSELLAEDIMQADGFSKDGERMGTGLNADGSMGMIRGMSAFSLAVPGSWLGSNRMLVKQRGLTRYKIADPWAMTEMQEYRDPTTGKYTGEKSAYGQQWSVFHTPTELKGGITSIIFYNSDTEHKDRVG
jgi:hypothetical protein